MRLLHNLATSSDSENAARSIVLERATGHWLGRFRAMASPCEILSDAKTESEARRLVSLCADEAWRVEDKFSRYRCGNIVHEINNANGVRVAVDEETAGLLDFAATLYDLSGGMFDISSGALREVWRFDGSDRMAHPAAIERVLPRIGFDKIDWQSPHITLPRDMQIDLGGIGKEYAVDRAAAACADQSTASCMVNFGGDLCVSRERTGGKPWRIGIEGAREMITLERGAIATSGDAHRYLLHEGVRYSHILNPKTGWPVADAPHSLTVLADTCTQAGMLATLGMLKGAGAEAFLDAQNVRYWARR